MQFLYEYFTAAGISETASSWGCVFIFLLGVATIYKVVGSLCK